MIKFNSQSERKQTAFLVVQTTVERHENKSRKTRINQQTITRNKKTKAMGNITPTMTIPEIYRCEILNSQSDMSF